MTYKTTDELYTIPIVEIYCDSNFNCRGAFDIVSVVELAKSIRDHGGLLEPLVIQPMDDVPKDEQPEGDYKFRLIAGHRRHKAIDELTDYDTAMCRIIKGLTKRNAHKLNFMENLQRKDLNILQEAEGMSRSWPEVTVQELKELLSKSTGWVTIRLKLLEMPEEIKLAAAAGTLTQSNIDYLAKLPSDNDRIRVSREMRGVKTKNVLEPKTYFKKRGARSKKEVGEFLCRLYTSKVYTSLNDRELALVASALAWSTRGIDSKEFLVERLDIPAECVSIDVDDTVNRLGE